MRAALEASLADLTRHGRAATAKDALGRFKQTVYKDRIANLPLESATRDDFGKGAIGCSRAPSREV